MPLADTGREQLLAAFEHQRAQNAALRQRQPLPGFFKHNSLLPQNPAECRVQIFHAHRLLPRRPRVVPRLVRQTLHVVGHVVGEIDDGGTEAGFGTQAGLRETCVEPLGEFRRVDFLQTPDGPGF